MSKRRTADANWYELPFAERKELMAGHVRVGRTYAGRILQLITGSTGLDDWEWGVTLLADDPVVLKDIVQEMRFDPCRRATRTSARSSPAWCCRWPMRARGSACAVGRAPYRRVMTHQDSLRLFVSFPETLVDRPLIYEIIKHFDVVPTSGARTSRTGRDGSSSSSRVRTTRATPRSRTSKRSAAP